ncbi:hypothetical protein AB5J62_33785 [Amycolatopsis sp. cg5]|uniref:hypothetical protein n=1 Tax=Amycolatopsis sp. cg5 TaxID=3238802 RepID=UPI0035243110
MNDAAVNREWTERFFAERGLRMTEEHWTAIEATVDAAPPIPAEVVNRLTAVINPVPPPTPDAGTPSTRRHREKRPPRSRRAESAA